MPAKRAQMPARGVEITHVNLYHEVPVAIDDLEEDPDNIRLENGAETVDGLSRALEHAGRYDVAPRVWRTADGRLRALAGSGRVRAAKKARQRNGDLREIPVIRVDPPKNRREKIFAQFAENALRDVLGPIDYGRGLRMLAQEGLTYDQILAELRDRGVLARSRTKAWVSQMIQLTELDPDVQLMVNRGQVSVWQGLQLRSLPPAEQQAAAQRAATENLSRADVRSMIQAPPEVLLEETRDLVREHAKGLEQARRGPEPVDPDHRHGRVATSWALLPSTPLGATPRSKVAGLQKLDWYRASASQEEQELALEAVHGGHTPRSAVDLVRRAVQEAPAASQPLRELLIALRQLAVEAPALGREQATAPAEFARLRLRALLVALGG